MFSSSVILRAGKGKPLNPALRFAVAVAVLACLSGVSAQQRQNGWSGFGNESDAGGSLVRTEGSGVIDEDLVKTAREVASHSTGTPNWINPRGFEKDVFTFARAVFKVGPNSARGYGQGRRLGWWVDFP